MFSRILVLLVFLILPLVSFVDQPHATVASFQLTWADNSTNEDGFIIERKIGTTGIFARIASVGADVTSYTDAGLADATTYCYRVSAFNSAGNSPYSPEICGTTPASPIAAFNLTVSSQGSGTITSAPGGISCSTKCSASFTTDISVILRATPAGGYTFSGWSGDSDCLDGRVTMNNTKSCIANFTRISSQTPTLTVNLVREVTAAGTGQGTVTSSPAGINCGGTCSASFSSGTLVTLTATPAVGSTFGGWSGTGCSSGVTTMNVARTCTATFNPQPAQTKSLLSIAKKGAGSGTVTSSPSGINCGSTCSASFTNGTLISLRAKPMTGSTFAGWSGTGCSTEKIMMDAARTCSATFNSESSQTKFSLSLTKKGTGSGSVMSTPVGINCGPTCSALFESGTVVTLKATAGSDSRFTGWNGQGCRTGTVTMSVAIHCTAHFQSRSTHVKTKFGVFRPDTGEWFLDNGNGHWDGCDIDDCVKSFGQTGDLPIVGSWSGNGLSNIGTFTPSTGTWRLDTNGDGVLDCRVDTCVDSLGQPGDFPIIRQLSNGKGSIVGTFTPQRVTTVWQRKVVQRGRWNFDVNGNSELDGCEVDECTIFRSVGELPVVGDWDGTGTQEIGVFLPRRGSWHLDRNGNGKWDGCERDKCFRHFGTEGDLPVVGDWDGTGSVRIGVFRPSTGMWYLDINGNGKMDSCTVDACFGPFGQLGDLPVVGKW